MQKKYPGNGNRLKDIVEVAGICIAVILVFTIITNGKFIAPANIKTLITNSVIPSFVAWGMVFIFTSGIMDLSLGSIIILSCNVAGIMGLLFGYVGLFAGGILTAIILEYINLKCFIITKIPSWVAGIGMTMVYESIGSFYSQQRIQAGLQVVDLGDNLRALGLPPYNIIVWIIGLILAYQLFNKSSVGLNIRAIGSNSSVSEMMGVNINRTYIAGGLVGGLFIGIASVLSESSSGRIMPTTGLSSIAQIFTPLAIFLLSMALESKINLSVGIMLSAFFIASLFNVLTILGVPSGTWQEVLLGLSVVIFGILSQRKNKGVVK